jgi:Zn-dependent protease
MSEHFSFIELVAQTITIMIPMLMSLTMHEFFHAWMARQLGDKTASRAGRLTLNPLAHADMMGTFVLPFLSLMAAGAGTQVPFIGWARPVPVDPTQFRRRVNSRLGMALVAFAGPVANFILALGSAWAMSLAIRQQWLSLANMAQQPLWLFLSTMLSINVGLFVFNMLPIYPLDGQQIVSSALSLRYSLQFTNFSMRFGGMLLLFVVFFAHELLSWPVNTLRNGLLWLVGL